MSVTSIVFSRDRPAQLDLLLRSMAVNAPQLAMHVIVVTAASEMKFGEAYNTLGMERRSAALIHETVAEPFREIVWDLLDAWNGPRHVAFFCDDDVIYRPLPVANPAAWLDLFPNTLCFSLRLGTENTTECYSLRQPQGIPFAKAHGPDFVSWDWRHPSASCDWSYPASLDGHIFRRDDLLTMLEGEEYANPNQLEEALVRGLARNARPLMAAFKKSVLVGVPINRVNTTHPNRAAESHHFGVADLNAGYLAGRRLSLEAFNAVTVDAAHVEVPLIWEDEA